MQYLLLFSSCQIWQGWSLGHVQDIMNGIPGNRMCLGIDNNGRIARCVGNPAASIFGKPFWEAL
jgi:hypothetical protein